MMIPYQVHRCSLLHIPGIAVIMVVMSGCLANPECYIDNKLLNKALGKTTFASNMTHDSGLTVDGDRDEYAAKCLNTLSVESPWLIVDLNETLPISTIVFTAITTYGVSIEYQILVGHTFDPNTFDPVMFGYEPCISRPVAMVEFEVMYVQCTRTLVGRFILIYRQQLSNLQVCEVEVYTEQVFQPEKWTCISPALQGPTGLLNLGRGRGPNSYQISAGWSGYSYKALDGNDEGVYETGRPCTATHTSAQAWWMVDLGQTAVITAVAITNRLNCCPERLNNFKVFVGNLAVAATSFVQTDYEVCAHYCTAPSACRKYYTCTRPIEGNYVAIAHVASGMLTLCEVEIYSDISDVTLPSWPANNRLNQSVLYDDDDSTCVQIQHVMGWKPFSVEIPWDPSAKTGIKPRTGYYHCRQHFYVNVTYSTRLHLGVSISKQQVNPTASGEYTYIAKSCEVIGQMEDEGVTRIRYACFCDVKCWVLIYVKHVRNMADGRLCSVHVYD